MSTKNGLYVAPALRKKHTANLVPCTPWRPVEQDTTSSLYDKVLDDRNSRPANASDQSWPVHSRWREGIANRAEPIENLINGLVADLPAGQKGSLINNYLAVRLELLEGHLHEIKASQLSFELRCLINDEWKELSFKLNAWNNENPRLQSLTQKLHDDLVSLHGKTTTRSVPKLLQKMTEVPKHEQEPKIVKGISSRDPHFKPHSEVDSSNSLNLNADHPTPGSTGGRRKPSTTLVLDKHYKPAHRIDPKTGRFRSRKDRIIWIDSPSNSSSLRHGARTLPEESEKQKALVDRTPKDREAAAMPAALDSDPKIPHGRRTGPDTPEPSSSTSSEEHRSGHI